MQTPPLTKLEEQKPQTSEEMKVLLTIREMENRVSSGQSSEQRTLLPILGAHKVVLEGEGHNLKYKI